MNGKIPPHALAKVSAYGTKRIHAEIPKACYQTFTSGDEIIILKKSDFDKLINKK